MLLRSALDLHWLALHLCESILMQHAALDLRALVVRLSDSAVLSLLLPLLCMEFAVNACPPSSDTPFV